MSGRLPDPQPITAENALKRAVFWLAALIAEADIDPDETAVRIRLGRAGETIGTQEINLGDDLRAFAELGAPSDMFDEMEDED